MVRIAVVVTEQQARWLKREGNKSAKLRPIVEAARAAEREQRKRAKEGK